MLAAAMDAPAQRLGVVKTGERTVDPAQHFAERNFGRWPVQLITPMRLRNSYRHAGALQIQQDRDSRARDETDELSPSSLLSK